MSEIYNSDKWMFSASLPLRLVSEAGRGVWAAIPAGIRGMERAVSSLCL